MSKSTTVKGLQNAPPYGQRDGWSLRRSRSWCGGMLDTRVYIMTEISTITREHSYCRVNRKYSYWPLKYYEHYKQSIALSHLIPHSIGSRYISRRIEITEARKQNNRRNKHHNSQETQYQGPHQHRTPTTCFYNYNTLRYSLYFVSILPHSSQLSQATT